MADSKNTTIHAYVTGSSSYKDHKLNPKNDFITLTDVDDNNYIISLPQGKGQYEYSYAAEVEFQLPPRPYHGRAWGVSLPMGIRPKEIEDGHDNPYQNTYPMVPFTVKSIDKKQVKNRFYYKINISPAFGPPWLHEKVKTISVSNLDDKSAKVHMLKENDPILCSTALNKVGDKRFSNVYSLVLDIDSLDKKTHFITSPKLLEYLRDSMKLNLEIGGVEATNRDIIMNVNTSKCRDIFNTDLPTPQQLQQAINAAKANALSRFRDDQNDDIAKQFVKVAKKGEGKKGYGI